MGSADGDELRSADDVGLRSADDVGPRRSDDDVRLRRSRRLLRWRWLRWWLRWGRPRRLRWPRPARRRRPLRRLPAHLVLHCSRMSFEPRIASIELSFSSLFWRVMKIMSYTCFNVEDKKIDCEA